MTNSLAKIVALGALVLLLGASHALAADAEVKIAISPSIRPPLRSKLAPR